MLVRAISRFFALFGFAEHNELREATQFYGTNSRAAALAGPFKRMVNFNFYLTHHRRDREMTQKF